MRCRTPRRDWRQAVAALTMAGGLLGTQASAAGTAPLWEAGMGVGMLTFPDYRGADQGRTYVAPFPYLIYRGKRLRIDRQGVRGLLFRSERLRLDLSADGAVPVDSRHNRARRGMPDLDPTVELGPSLDIVLARTPRREWRFRLPLRAAVATNLHHFHYTGWVFNPNLSLTRYGHWEGSLSLGPLFASRAYHAYYYDVPAAYATAQRPAYAAPGGYSGLRLTLSASRRRGRLWFGGFLRYDDLHGAAFAGSPLVRRDGALMVGLGVAYILEQSAVRVPAAEDELRR